MISSGQNMNDKMIKLLKKNTDFFIIYPAPSSPVAYRPS